MTRREPTEADVRSVTPERAGELLGIHRKTVLELIHAGDLPAANISQGSKPVYRIRLRDIDALLTARAA